MPLNFPSNPSLNDTYTLGDKKWVYDGKGWKLFSASFELVPIVYAHANGAFDKANSANSLAQAAFDAANNAGSSAEIQSISTHANAAFDKANSANVLAQAAFDSGNATYIYANSGYSHANSAFDKANSANVLAQSAYDIAVTDVTSISVTANNYGSSTIVPVMRIEANGRISSVSNVSIEFPVTSVGGNTGIVTNQNLLDSIKQVDGSGSGLDADLLDGQQGTYYLDWTNTTNKPDPVVTVTLDGDVSGTSSATLSDLTSNTITITTTVSDNSHNHSIANVFGLQSALDAKYDKTGGTISGDVQISGNLIVVGNTVTYSANDVIVNDPILLIANNNSDNVLDIGFSAHYVESTILKHTGLIRDVSTSTWYLFEGYEPDIQGANVLNIADPTLVISTLKANIDSQSVIVRGQDVLDRTNAAFNRANTDVTSISTTAGVYGNNTIVPVITLEANGRIRSIANVSISGIGGGTATLTWIKKTANYTANVGDRIIADTTDGSFTLTLPATPTLGSSVTIADGNNWYTNNLTIARNGSTIEGLAEDLILDIEGIQVDVIFDGSTWEVYTFSGPAPFPSPTSNTGRLLTTDGNITSWSVITESYVNASFNQANLAFNTANSISGITTATPNTLVQRDSFADIYANNLYANNLVSTSDIRFKNNIEEINNPIELLNKLNGVSFNWINTETKSYGLIAQELEKVMPELVSTTNDVKSVMYIPIIAILIEAIKQQQKEIEEIRNGKT